MYWLFVFSKGKITPGQYYAMGTGEKALIRAFVRHYIEARA